PGRIHARPSSSSPRSWRSSSSWSGRAAGSCALRPSKASASTNLPRKWCAKVAKETAVEVQIEGRTLKLTNLEKVLYPEVGFTKGQVIDYYTRIAPVLLPHTRDHPLTLKRYPNGVDRDYRRVLPHRAHAPRSFCRAWPRVLRQDIGFQGPAALRSAQYQGHVRRDQSRVERTRTVFGGEASRPRGAQAAEGAAYGTGADRLEPERPVQDDDQRLLPAGACTADRVDACDVGRGRKVPQGEGPEPPGVRFGAGAQARGEARRPVRTGAQEKAEASQVAAPAHGRCTRAGEDGQP